MNHAESQDLLLDLAYGELDPARAAEVQAHLQGCPDCKREQQQIADMRKLSAPLRDLEEPSPGFDARVLTAARAEASLQSDGLPGQVIETTGGVQPLGVQAARIDAAAQVARPPARRKPRWALRAAIGGSAAAAAALTLAIVNRSNDGARSVTPESAYSIQVGKAAEDARRAAQDNARAAKGEKSEPAPAAVPVPPATPSPPFRDTLAEQKPKLEKGKPRLARREAGAGGDAAAGAAAPTAAPARPAALGKELATRRDSDPRQKLADSSQASRAAAGSSHDSAARPQLEVKKDEAPRTREREIASAAQAKAPAAAGVAGKSGAKAVAPAELGAIAQAELDAAARNAVQPANPTELEDEAQRARHGGNYALAAALYRKAASLRGAGAAADVATAAWDLAHAVECLSAAGQLEEGRSVRAELGSKYPAEKGAYSAARRALQEF